MTVYTISVRYQRDYKGTWSPAFRHWRRVHTFTTLRERDQKYKQLTSRDNEVYEYKKGD